jgi:hypothetical protein
MVADDVHVASTNKRLQDAELKLSNTESLAETRMPKPAA